LGNNTRNVYRKMEEVKHLIVERDGYKSVHTTVPIGKRELILHLTGLWTPYPTRTSIQVGERHLESETGACINHSCYPNAEIIYIQGWNANEIADSELPLKPPARFFELRGLVSLKEINKGEEITFDYNKTEDVLANPFKCSCCGKEIKGRLREISWKI